MMVSTGKKSRGEEKGKSEVKRRKLVSGDRRIMGVWELGRGRGCFSCLLPNFTQKTANWASIKRLGPFQREFVVVVKKQFLSLHILLIILLVIILSSTQFHHC